VVDSNAYSGNTEHFDPHFNRLPLRQLIVVGGGIYVAQGLIGGLTFQGLPALLRANQISLDMIGLVFLAMIPWALKFLWAPMVEFRRIGRNNQRRSRPIILTGELLSAMLLASLAFIGFQSILSVVAILFVLAVVASTVDIACDGFMIEQLKPSTRGWGNTAQMGGGYTGYLIGGGLFLWVYESLGQTIAFLSLAAFILLFTLPFFFLKEPKQHNEIVDHKPSLGYALSRPEIPIGIVIMVLYDLGIRIASSLVGPFMVDQGISLSTIGMVSGVGGTLAGLCGTIFGGVIVRYLGASFAVVLAIILQSIILGMLYFISIQSVIEIEFVIAAVLVKTFIMGIGFVCIYSLLMGFASLRQAAVDFTIFQCVDAAIAALGGFGAGVIAEHYGYAGAFALAASFSACAIVIVSGVLLKYVRLKKEEQPA
jgi:MFS transporter, putative signal transducer